MFGIGLPEMIVILIVALVVVGPDKLPEMARSLAKVVNDLKGTLEQVKENLSEETKVISSVQQDLQKTAVQMKDHLLEDGKDRDSDTKIWRPEDALTDDRDTDEDDDVIDMQAFAERPWEKDAAARPEKGEEVEEHQEKKDKTAAVTPTDTVKKEPAVDNPESGKIAASTSHDKVPPPSTTV